MEDVHRAIHETVLEAGPKALAHLMGMSHTNLLNRVNPNDDTHRLTFEQFLQVLVNSGDIRALRAIANEMGHDLVARKPATARELTGSMMQVGKEVADLTLAVHDALEDNHVNQIEKAAIRKEIQHVRESLDVMEASVKVA